MFHSFQAIVQWALSLLAVLPANHDDGDLYYTNILDNIPSSFRFDHLLAISVSKIHTQMST